MEDITGILRYEASSRQTMIGCLTDGSGETFWETGEEVRLKINSQEKMMIVETF